MSIEREIFALLTAGTIAVPIVIVANFLQKRSAKRQAERERVYQAANQKRYEDGLARDAAERAKIAAYSDQEFFDKMIRMSGRSFVSRNAFDQDRKIYYSRPCLSPTGSNELYLGKTKQSNETADEFYARIRQAYNQGGLLPDLELYGDFTIMETENERS